jgi:asparagine synthase (glutamine-hydrolysing)|tara:strand:- start:3209 stop:5038 length:1830 start_codon:yes stop_codon:yes gene_type:complete
MCGYVIAIGDGNNLIDSVRKSTEITSYRGPDETTFYNNLNEKIYIGFNRLSVMEPKNGSQPLMDNDKKIIICFNGEIYNQFEIRNELKKNNIHFKTKSLDTEVILKGYLFYGEKIFTKLDGQFSISIIDLKKNKIILARDKFGEKPLYYFKDNNKIIVGSDLKIYKNFKNIDLSFNNKNIKKFFIYSSVPAPNTIFKNIYKVKHSEVVSINIPNKKIVKYNYYIPKIIKDKNVSVDYYIDKMDSLLDKSVKSRLITDSKIGIFLSGGLDSSLISYYGNKYNDNLKFFSISVKEESFDEIDKAQKMAQFFNKENNSVELNQNKFDSEYENILNLLDEPIGAPTFIPMYYLSRNASKHIKSVLSGDGADEIFGGYENFKYIDLISYINNLRVNKILGKFTKLINFLPISKKNLSNDFKIRRFAQGIIHDKKFQNTMFLSSLSLADLNDLFNENIPIDDLLDDVCEFEKKYENVDNFEKNYLYFVDFYIPDIICARADKASMLNSLEIRSPFLNPEILEFSLSLPKNMRYLLKDKLILRMLAQKKISKDFLKLKKGGFTFPIQKWLKVSKNKFKLNDSKYNDMVLNHLNKKSEYRNFFHCNNALNNFSNKIF